MSRSYKQTPSFTCGEGGLYRKFAKRQANRRIRRYRKPLEDGSCFKLLFDSWEIKDYTWFWYPGSHIPLWQWRMK